MSPPITTTGAVIDALGGTGAVASLMDTTPQVVSNWRRFEAFPANTFVELQDALTKRGLSAPPSLWRMKERRPSVRAGAAA